jgi:hypothetical protein
MRLLQNPPGFCKSLFFMNQGGDQVSDIVSAVAFDIRKYLVKR